MRSIKYLFLFLGVIFSRCVCAQKPWVETEIFKRYSPSDKELPAAFIMDMAFDDRGYMWLATDAGVYRWDSRRYESLLPGNPIIIKIFRFLLNNRETMLCLEHTGKTFAVDVASKAVINTDSLWHLNELKKDDRPYIRAFFADGNAYLVKLGIDVNADEFLMVCASDEGSRIVPVQEAEKILDAIFCEGFPEQIAAQIRGKKLGTSVISLSRPNNLLVAGNTVYTRWGTITIEEDVAKSALYGLISGDDLWVALTNGGVLWYPGFKQGNRKPKGHFLKSEKVMKLVTDNSGNIFARLYGTKSFCRIKNGEQSISLLQLKAPQLTKPALISVRAVDDMTAVVAYDMSTMYWCNKLGGTFVSADGWVMCAERAGDKYYAVIENRLNCAQAPASGALPSSFPKTIRDLNGAGRYKDKRIRGNDLYLLFSEVLLKISSSGTIEELPLPEHEKAAFSFDFDTAGNFYLGTSNSIYCNNKKLPWPVEEHFLVVRVVGNALWVATKSGLYCSKLSEVNTEKGFKKLTAEPVYDFAYDEHNVYAISYSNKIITFSAHDAHKLNTLNTTEFSTQFEHSAIGLQGDSVLISSDVGLFYFPKSFLKGRPERLPAVEVSNLSDTVNRMGYFAIRYGPTVELTLHVSVLNYGDQPINIRYRILKNGNELYKWANTSPDNDVRLLGMMPGRYLAEYLVTNEETGEQKMVRYVFYVNPCWCQIASVRIAIGLAILAIFSLLLVLLIQRRHKQTVRRLEEQLRINEMKAKALSAQLNPHFIFNALTPFQYYILKNDTKGALDYVQKFAQLMRGILNSSRMIMIPLQDELNFLRGYLDVHRERLEDRFTYAITVAEDIDPTKVELPTLFLQPIVENAVEHGVEPLSANGFIGIDISRTENKLVVTISDNGKGFPDASKLPENHALNIISERLELMHKIYGVGSLSFGNRPEGGAFVQIKLYAPPLEIGG